MRSPIAEIPSLSIRSLVTAVTGASPWSCVRLIRAPGTGSALNAVFATNTEAITNLMRIIEVPSLTLVLTSAAAGRVVVERLVRFQYTSHSRVVRGLSMFHS